MTEEKETLPILLLGCFVALLKTAVIITFIVIVIKYFIRIEGLLNAIEQNTRSAPVEKEAR